MLPIVFCQSTDRKENQAKNASTKRTSIVVYDIHIPINFRKKHSELSARFIRNANAFKYGNKIYTLLQ